MVGPNIMKFLHRLCFYCSTWKWYWQGEETHHPSPYGYREIWVCKECMPIWEKKEKESMRRFRASLVPPDNGYMPQEVKDWIEGK
jgi:hypothetical protein